MPDHQIQQRSDPSVEAPLHLYSRAQPPIELERVGVLQTAEQRTEVCTREMVRAGVARTQAMRMGMARTRVVRMVGVRTNIEWMGDRAGAARISRSGSDPVTTLGAPVAHGLRVGLVA